MRVVRKAPGRRYLRLQRRLGHRRWNPVGEAAGK